MKYRLKTEDVEAFRFGIDPQPEWFVKLVESGSAIIREKNEERSGRQYEIPFTETMSYCLINSAGQTRVGKTKADYGDYIIFNENQDTIGISAPDFFETAYIPVTTIEITESDALYIWNLMPRWVKSGVIESSDPTMYGTGHRWGDLRAQEKIRKILNIT